MRFLLSSLNKKRSQSREATISIVKYALNEVYDTLNEEEKLKLLSTLIEITEGRIFVEFEFSVAIRRLTEIHIQSGNINEAAKCIQDIQIETFGSLERGYKVEYILFQMKILLMKEDYIRVMIVSNKINKRHLNEEGLEKLKFEFFELMIRYYTHEEKFIDASKSFKILYDSIKEFKIKLENNSSNAISQKSLINIPHLVNNVSKNKLFVNYVMFLSICPPELETKNMFNELNLFYKKDLEQNPDMLVVVKKRLSDDVVKIDNNFFERFITFPIFAKDEHANAEKHWKLFRKYWV